MIITQIDVTGLVRARVYDTADQADTNPSAVLRVELADELATGTGADQANQVYYDAQTIALSTRVTYDLAGTLVDVFGDTITFARVKTIMIYNASTAGVLDVGGGTDGGGTNAFVNWISAAAEEVEVRPGGFLLLHAPDATAYPVTAATADILGLNEIAAAACPVQVAFVGVV